MLNDIHKKDPFNRYQKVFMVQWCDVSKNKGTTDIEIVQYLLVNLNYFSYIGIESKGEGQTLRYLRNSLPTL